MFFIIFFVIFGFIVCVGMVMVDVLVMMFGVVGDDK